MTSLPAASTGDARHSRQEGSGSRNGIARHRHCVSNLGSGAKIGATRLRGMRVNATCRDKRDYSVVMSSC
jgi:hypothetical protein